MTYKLTQQDLEMMQADLEGDRMRERDCYPYWEQIAEEAKTAQDEYNLGVQSLQIEETLRGRIK
jgi:hypothetical protein